MQCERCSFWRTCLFVPLDLLYNDHCTVVQGGRTPLASTVLRKCSFFFFFFARRGNSRWEALWSNCQELYCCVTRNSELNSMFVAWWSADATKGVTRPPAETALSPRPHYQREWSMAKNDSSPRIPQLTLLMPLLLIYLKLLQKHAELFKASALKGWFLSLPTQTFARCQKLKGQVACKEHLPWHQKCTRHNAKIKCHRK